MENELEFIIDLMHHEINIDTLKKIKQRIDNEKDVRHVERIKESKDIIKPTSFLFSTKTIKVNYIRMLDYLEKLESVMKTDMPESRTEEIKLIKLLTIYRMFMHELYHSKQIYEAFDTDINDLETEMTRSLYNFNRKEYLEKLQTKTRRQLIEEKTLKINNILYNYPEINTLDRKAEIESLKYVRRIIKPIQADCMNTYNELQLMEFSKLIAGYDKQDAPYIEALNKIKQLDPSFIIKYPYEYSNKNLFLNTVKNITTEKERFELGLEVSTLTIDNTYTKINKLLGY